jgi:glucosylceramidase
MMEWTQSAVIDGGYRLAERMPPITLTSMDAPSGPALLIDRSKTYQEIIGFGGAFTEASAINWRSLSMTEQAGVINAYFASPEQGGLGYTVGRVPINSCDFGPGDWQRTCMLATSLKPPCSQQSVLRAMTHCT